MDRGLFLRRSTFGLACILTGAVYFLAAKFGLSLAFQHPSATFVWPPTGIAIAAFILFGYRLWPAVYLAAFLANETTAGNAMTSLGIAAGNTLEGVLGAYLANKFADGRYAFDRSRTIYRWTLMCAILAPAVSATVGVTSLLFGGFAQRAQAGSIWLTWWLGDAGGALIVAPAILLWARSIKVRPTQQEVLEAAIVGFALIVLSGFAFGVPIRWTLRTYPLPFELPLLVWVGFRLGGRATVTAVIALSILAIWGTLEGQGSFAQHTKEDSLLLLQIYLAISSATALAVAASVQERRDAEQVLALLAAAVESSDDAVSVVNLDGTIVRWNRAAEKLYGYTEDEMRGRPIWIAIPEELRTQEQAILARVVRGERIDHYESVRQRKDGSKIDVSLTISPVKNGDGRIIAASKIARDITDQKRAQQEIVRLNTDLERRVEERTARLESAVRELESFTYTVAHDLRAPLRGIHQYCDLLEAEKSGEFDSEARDWIRRVADGARRMDSLIESLLAYSRIGREEIKLSSLDPGALISDILAHLKVDLDARKAEVNVDAELPRVVANPVLLNQALTNIVSNAIKFVPPDRNPQVRIHALRKDGRVELSVEDNGIGIDPRFRDRLFRIFERLHPRDQYPGTGIGLAIVKKAVERMGGTVGFRPAPGRGTCFYLELPAPEMEDLRKPQE